MFQFPRFASKGLCIQPKDDTQKVPGCPIRKSTDPSSFAASRGLSQLITSFIACPCQGIHHAPFLAYTFEILHKSGSRELPVEEFSALVLRSDESHLGFHHFCALFILANIIMSKNLDHE